MPDVMDRSVGANEAVSLRPSSVPMLDWAFDGFLGCFGIFVEFAVGG